MRQICTQLVSVSLFLCAFCSITSVEVLSLVTLNLLTYLCTLVNAEDKQVKTLLVSINKLDFPSLAGQKRQMQLFWSQSGPHEDFYGPKPPTLYHAMTGLI